MFLFFMETWLNANDLVNVQQSQRSNIRSQIAVCLHSGITEHFLYMSVQHLSATSITAAMRWAYGKGCGSRPVIVSLSQLLTFPLHQPLLGHIIQQRVQKPPQSVSAIKTFSSLFLNHLQVSQLKQSQRRVLSEALASSVFNVKRIYHRSGRNAANQCQPCFL